MADPIKLLTDQTVTLVRGQTREETLQVTDASSNPVDITGAEIILTVKSSNNGAVLLRAATSGSGDISITDAVNGEYKYTIPDSYTDAWNQGTYYYDIVVRDVPNSGDTYYHVKRSKWVVQGSTFTAGAASVARFGVVDFNQALILPGTNQLDGDQVDIDYTPSNYTPTLTGVAADTDDLAAHLKGLDDALSTIGSTIDHDSLTGFVANEHIDHSAVTILAGAGLNGGGTLVGPFIALNVDIDSLNEESSPTPSSDYAVMVYSVAGLEKVTLDNLPASGLSDVVDDTTPQLGGSLDVNGQKIVSVSNGNIDIEPNGTGNVLLGNLTFDADQSVGAGQDNYVLTYDNGTGLISLEAAAASGLSDVVDDTTPQLGGSLDVNGNKIVSVSNGDIDIEPNGTGNVLLGNYTFDADQSVGAGQDNYVLTYDNGTGLISLEAAAGGGLADVVDDTTPQLGGNLDCNGFELQLDEGDNLVMNGDTTANSYLTYGSGGSLGTQIYFKGTRAARFGSAVRFDVETYAEANIQFREQVAFEPLDGQTGTVNISGENSIGCTCNAAVTVNLPNGPRDGTVMRIYDDGQGTGAGTHNITINRGGGTDTIGTDGGTSMTISGDDGFVDLWYTALGANWKVIQTGTLATSTWAA